MREILFRGKGTINNEWIYGDLLYYADTAQIWQDSEFGKYTASVIPETLGQFTGLTDKNGVKIFEGDIVEYTTKLSRNTEEIVNVYEIKYSKEQARFIASLPNGVFDPVAMRYGKVIGNIYDNPELIGGEAE